MRVYKKILLFVCLISALVLPALVLAANPALNKLENVGTVEGPYQADSVLSDIIGIVIGVGLGLIGVVFLILMIYAGYNWMTAQGEEEKVTKAKETIIRAIIGLIIVIGSYAVWRFVFSRLV